MKLFDGAVLLIIGAAIVGPIESRMVYNIPEGDCLAYHQPAEKDRTAETLAHAKWVCERDRSRVETPAETCERAMREIGVDTTAEGRPLYGVVTKDGRFIYSVGSWPASGSAQWDVRCIPAPFGLR